MRVWIIQGVVWKYRVSMRGEESLTTTSHLNLLQTAIAIAIAGRSSMPPLFWINFGNAKHRLSDHDRYTFDEKDVLYSQIIKKDTRGMPKNLKHGGAVYNSEVTPAIISQMPIITESPRGSTAYEPNMR